MTSSYVARYDGEEFPCTVALDATGPQVLLMSSRARDEFRHVGAGRYVRVVTPEACERIEHRVQVASLGNAQVVVLETQDEGVEVEFLGPNRPTDPAARQVGRGVWRRVVDPSELRNHAAATTPLLVGSDSTSPAADPPPETD
ncbi:hypothetical protein [Blastococcus sp. Marseille-P5729]|uniref:hypothetical protein n=1 Tax=Blastococcus sp. Marseille-P5729 TaxID=2086582 RepID=UPI000D113E36|nr:hypothetical protein [Blastococcus sp. Marseille-P5729]